VVDKNKFVKLNLMEIVKEKVKKIVNEAEGVLDEKLAEIYNMFENEEIYEE
jgi:hypothetical protein